MAEERMPDLADPISQTVEMIGTLHARSEKRVGRHQRAIEFLTAQLGRPGFLYTVVVVVAVWIGGNEIAEMLGHQAWDPPPFAGLQGVASISALLVTIIVLTTQNRLGNRDEQRSQLDLQMSLLVEQKVTKLIELMEELRRDIPSVRDREDLEAKAMSEAADPHAVLTALEVTLNHGDTIEALLADVVPERFSDNTSI